MHKFPRFSDPLHGPCSLQSLHQLPKGCTVAPPEGHIHLLDLITPSAHCKAENSQLCVSDPDLLIRHLSLEEPGFGNRFFFIAQKDPRSALNTTINLLEPIIHRYRITPLFLDLVSSFTKGVIRTEDGYCPPIRIAKGEDTLEICYMYKYAELKSPARTTHGHPPYFSDSWEIRKTGVYHRLDLRTMQSVWIILSPTPASLGETRLRECMQSDFGQQRISKSPLYVHAVLISCYLANWRQYCAHYERALSELSGRVMTIDLNSDFDISHETLRQINYLKQKLLPLRPAFAALGLVFNTLEQVFRSQTLADRGEDTDSMLRNLHNESTAYAETSNYLLQLAERIQVQTSDTLDLKNQDIFVQQNDQLFKLARASANDSLSIRVITIVTLIYLPFSFVATLMGMCFFEMDISSNRIVVSSQLWVFFCASLPLAILTIILWRWVTSRKLPLLWKKTKLPTPNPAEKQV